ncbi:hypothetical protein NESM_000259700 [Novymonas esmeraldas]|uniref:Uncharacterized protein n=1 Tax=Novymonas esmeraldas TaxID=1808958 RepID=A0AAW0F954_9TRYP
MGNRQSQVPQEGQGHPVHYYRGVAAAKEARFSMSELYFVQALEKHPGREFWDTLMGAVFRDIHKTAATVALGRNSAVDDRHKSRKSTPTAGDGESEKAASPVHRDAAAQLSGSRPPSGVKKEPEGKKWQLRRKADATAVPGMVDSDEVNRQTVEARLSAVNALYHPRVVPIELPLDAQLTDILDFFRMLADIAHTYFELLPTTRHREKVTSLAARYCLLTISHTQVLLHCLALWKEENLGDGLGFIDYKRKRRRTLTVTLDEDEEDEVSDGERRKSRHGKTEQQNKSRAAALMVTLGLIEANCRYYYISMLLSYSFVVLLTSASVSDAKRQHQLQANVADHIDAVYSTVQDLAREYPNEYIGELISTHIPKPSWGESREGPSSASAASFASNHKALTIGSDDHRHIYVTGGTWSPTMSGLIPLDLVRNTRLCVQVGSSRRAVAHLLTPAERMSFHYVTWHMEDVFLAVPGCSPYMLVRALPGYQLGPGTASHKTEMLSRPNANEYPTERADPVAVSSVAAAEAVLTASTAEEGLRSAAEQTAFVRKCKDTLKRSGRNMNTDLDLSDEHTCVMLFQDEVAILSLLTLLTSAEIRKMSGQPAAALPFAVAVSEMVSALHGPDSPEMHMVRHLLTAGATE